MADSSTLLGVVLLARHGDREGTLNSDPCIKYFADLISYFKAFIRIPHRTPRRRPQLRQRGMQVHR